MGGGCRADYNEWGQITYSAALSITSSYRRIWPQLSYTGHDWDDVLGMYYAKARFYTADDKRFVAMDPIKGNITEPLSLVPYVYCVDNPLRWVDPLGKAVHSALELIRYGGGGTSIKTDIVSANKATPPTSNQNQALTPESQFTDEMIVAEIKRTLSEATLSYLSTAAGLFYNSGAFMVGFTSGIVQSIEDLTVGNLINLSDHIRGVNTSRVPVCFESAPYPSSEYERYMNISIWLSL